MTITKVLSGISIQYARRTNLFEASLTNGLSGFSVRLGSKKRLTANFLQLDRLVMSCAACVLISMMVLVCSALTNNFFLEDRCSMSDQIPFFPTLPRRAFVFAMRHRNRPNKDGIAILALSVTTKDFPHAMLLTTCTRTRTRSEILQVEITAVSKNN